MQPNTLLDTYLHQLRLPTFVKNYAPMATDAARTNQDYVRFLLALAEQEVNQRESNRLQMRIKAARFPVIKELADFDFSVLPIVQRLCISSQDRTRKNHTRKCLESIFTDQR